MKGCSQQLQFIHDCGLIIISFNFSCRDFNVSLKLYAVIKFRAKLKTAQLKNFLFCRDIFNLWWDKSSLGSDIKHLLFLLRYRNNFLLEEFLLARLLPFSSFNND